MHHGTVQLTFAPTCGSVGDAARDLLRKDFNLSVPTVLRFCGLQSLGPSLDSDLGLLSELVFYNGEKNKF